jgi:hypothetical protein
MKYKLQTYNRIKEKIKTNFRKQMYIQTKLRTNKKQRRKPPDMTSDIGAKQKGQTTAGSSTDAILRPSQGHKIRPSKERERVKGQSKVTRTQTSRKTGNSKSKGCKTGDNQNYHLNANQRENDICSAAKKMETAVLEQN